MEAGTGIAGPMGGIRSAFLPAVALLFPLLTGTVQAIQFPDTSALKREWKISQRVDGKPAGLFRKTKGDSLAMRLDWGPRGLSAVRLDQPEEIDPDSFEVLTREYGNGAAWHENTGTLDPRSVAMYPGLRQEWNLKGFGGERGWLGSGVDRGRYFLIFRAEPPAPRVPAEGPLRLSPGLYAFLDTSSEWLHVDCKEMPGSGSAISIPEAAKLEPGKSAKPACFSPGDDPHWLIRIDGRQPMRLQAWSDEQGSPALAEIRRAIVRIPDASQHEYAKDLSQMLLGEGQMFLVKLAQRLPAAFTWPSWQIQDLQSGKVPHTEFLPLIRRQTGPGEFLPAFRSDDGGLRLAVDLYYRGTIHLTAEGKP